MMIKSRVWSAQLSYFNFLTYIANLSIYIPWMPINITFMHQNTKNVLFTCVPYTLKGRRQVEVKTWIKMGELPLISVLIKGESLLFQIPTLQYSHILWPNTVTVCIGGIMPFPPGILMGLVGSCLNPAFPLTQEVLFIHVPLNLHFQGRGQVKLKT